MNVAATYQEFWSFIDFVIYLVIFTGLAHFVFSKKFPGRAGKAVSIGLAMALSAGMALFSHTTGFRLGNLGPIAGVILLVLVGLLIYSVIRQLGGKTTTSAIIAFIAAYFLTRATFPEIYAWAQQNEFAAWLDAAMLLAIPALVIMLLLRWKGRDLKNLSMKELDLGPGPEVKATERQELENLQNREKLEKQSYKAEKSAGKSEKTIAKDLKSIIKALKQGGIAPETAGTIRRHLSDLKRQDLELVRAFNQIRLLSQKIENWDMSGFKRFSETYQKLSREDQERLKAVVQAEQKTIVEERTMHNIERQIQDYQKRYHQLLNLAVNQLGHRNSAGAAYYLSQALETETESKNLLSRLRQMQKQLLNLTKSETQIMRKMAA